MVLRAADAKAKPKHAVESFNRKVLPVVILAVAAILLLLYPVVVTQLNNWEQMRTADKYSQEIDNTDQQLLADQLASAHEYNRTHSSGPILDPWLTRISEDNEDYQAYLAELDAHDVMARLVVPSADIDLPVYHGTNEDVLQKGVGHLYGSDLPVGGEGTHSVLTAHTGLVNASLFDTLTDVEMDDPIYVSVSGEKMKYQVNDIRVVLPHETDSLRPEADKDQVTLITCTPYGVNSHRLLVTGQRVPYDEEAGDVFKSRGLTWSCWMWAFIGAAVLLALLTLAWLKKMNRKHKEKYSLPSLVEQN